MELRNFVVLLPILIGTFGMEVSAGKSEPGKSSRHIAGIADATSYSDSLDKTRLADTENCSRLLSQQLIDEIKGYQTVATQIIDLVVNGDFKGRTYQELHDLVDLYPIRQSGFENLEQSIDYMMDRMKHYDFENVRGEQVLVPHWVRGEESAQLLEPHRKNIRLLGLGRTVGTPDEGITAQVIVVKNFTELEERQAEVPGKIVVYNQGWLGSYGATNIYRTGGASRAARFGAVGALVQSVAPFSLDTPHTGGQTYEDGVPHIPVACITMEDADYLYRLQEKKKRISINLKLADYNLPMTISRNPIGEIVGKTKPAEYVAVTGHIDSWDVGQGAMDDAGGVMISVMALAALKHLKLQPARTLQAILWTSEEPGLWGVQDFVKQHKDILPNYSVVFESDSGTFKPRGLDFAGNETAGCIVNEVLKLTAAINTTTYARYPSVSSDITKLIAEGVPGLSLNNENDKYFWYHHTEADTITMMDSQELDLNTALWAVSSYVLSDISVKLPRDPPPSPNP